MSGRGTRKGTTWSPEQRKRFAASMARKRAAGWSNATGLRGNADKIVKLEVRVRFLESQVESLDLRLTALGTMDERMKRLERSLISTVVREPIAAPNTPRFS